MSIKATIALLSIISLTVNADWSQSEKSLYTILKIKDARIISINQMGSSLITTIQTPSDLYRCDDIHNSDPPYTYKCWLLESD